MELGEKIASKKKGRDFEIDGIHVNDMEEHTTEGNPSLADQFRQQEQQLQRK